MLRLFKIPKNFARLKKYKKTGKIRDKQSYKKEAIGDD